MDEAQTNSNCDSNTFKYAFVINTCQHTNVDACQCAGVIIDCSLVRLARR